MRNKIRQIGRAMTAILVASIAASAGFGVQTALSSHEHTASLWYHGVYHGVGGGTSTDGRVHDHMHSTDGNGRAGYLAYGECNLSHSPEIYDVSTHIFIDLTYVYGPDEQLNFASVRSPQTGLGHHHHNHYYSC